MIFEPPISWAQDAEKIYMEVNLAYNSYGQGCKNRTATEITITEDDLDFNVLCTHITTRHF